MTNTNSIIANKDYTAGIKNKGSPLNGFPTIRYMTNQGAVIENYEDSNIATKDRTIDSFMEWIKSKTGNKPKMIASRKIRRRTRNNKKFNKQIKSRKHR